jgi:hypothetical protein
MIFRIHSWVSSLINELRFLWICMLYDSNPVSVQCIHCYAQHSDPDQKYLKYDGRFFYHPSCRKKAQFRV